MVLCCSRKSVAVFYISKTFYFIFEFLSKSIFKRRQPWGLKKQLIKFFLNRNFILRTIWKIITSTIVLPLTEILYI